MKTMAKTGILMTVSAVLLLLAAGPVWGSVMFEYRILIDGADPGATSLLATGSTHAMSIEVRALGQTVGDGKWSDGTWDYYSGVANVGYSLVDSTGISAGSLVSFAKSGTVWDATYPADFTATKTKGTVNLTNDVNRAVFGNNLNSTGFGTALTGDMGGLKVAAGTASPDFSKAWYTVETGNFTWTGTGTQVATITVSPTLGTGGTKFAAHTYLKTVDATVTTYSAGTTSDSVDIKVAGGGGEIYDTQAQAGEAGAGAAMGAANWNHPAHVGWWDATHTPGSGTASITLDGSAALNSGQPFAKYIWTIIDDGTGGKGSGTTLLVTSTTPMATVTVAQLITAGFNTPPKPHGTNFVFDYASVNLRVEDSSGLNWGVATGAKLFLPEPATLAVLAFGAVGVLIRRRRK